jgi:hypothetical protein
MVPAIRRHTGPVVLKLPLWPPVTVIGFWQGNEGEPLELLLELDEELE